MESADIQFAGLLVSISVLLGFVVRELIKYFTKSNNEQQTYIETLVSQNQKNTVEFLNALNHQQTLNREMQQRTNETVKELGNSVNQMNSVSERMLALLSRHNQI